MSKKNYQEPEQTTETTEEDEYYIPDESEVEVKEDYKLLITFVTGEQKLFDFKPLLDQVYYKELKDNEELFKKATVGGDTVVWNDEIDIAPEYLYEHGIPV